MIRAAVRQIAALAGVQRRIAFSQLSTGGAANCRTTRRFDTLSA
jgi:hypothetical protein